MINLYLKKRKKEKDNNNKQKTIKQYKDRDIKIAKDILKKLINIIYMMIIEH